MSDIYTIKATHVEALEAQIAILNKKAVKLGCQPAVLTFLGEKIVTRKDEVTGIEHQVVYKLVSVEGETPKFAGWTLVAAIEKQESGENLVSCVPGQAPPQEYRTTDGHCDHCNVNRRRKEVFVLRHDDGKHVQVGRQCIGDFLGTVSPEAIVSRAAWAFDLGRMMSDAEGEEWGGGGRVEIGFGMDQFVKTTALVIRKLGWVSRKVAQEMEFTGGPRSTCEIVMGLLSPPPRDSDARRILKEFIAKHDLYATERDEKLATEAIAWGKALATDDSEYLYNLGVAVRLDFVKGKTAGLMCSLISAFQRHLDREAELNMKKATNKDRKHVGVVGERQGFEQLTVKTIRSFDNEWGVTTLIRFEDAAGNVIVWFKSGDTYIEEGQVLDITGTIKAHEDYKGTPQTVIQRAKIGLPKVKKKKVA